MQVSLRNCTICFWIYIHFFRSNDSKINILFLIFFNLFIFYLLHLIFDLRTDTFNFLLNLNLIILPRLWLTWFVWLVTFNLRRTPSKGIDWFPLHDVLVSTPQLLHNFCHHFVLFKLIDISLLLLDEFRIVIHYLLALQWRWVVWFILF